MKQARDMNNTQVSFLEAELDKWAEAEAGMAQQLADLEEVNRVYRTRHEGTLSDLKQLRDDGVASRNTIASLRNAVTRKDIEMTALREELESKQREIAMMRDQVASNLQEIASLGEMLRAKDAEAAGAREGVALRDTEVAALRQRLCDTESELVTAGADAQAACSREHQTLLEHVARSDSHAASLRQSLATRDDELSAVRASLEIKDAELAAAHKNEESLDAAMGSLLEQLEAQVTEIQRLGGLLQSRQGDVDTMQAQLSDANARRRSAEEQLQTANSHIESLRLAEEKLRDDMKLQEERAWADQGQVRVVRQAPSRATVCLVLLHGFTTQDVQGALRL